MSITDIRPLKAALRDKYRHIRLQMPTEERHAADARIAERVRNLLQYQSCRTLLT